MILVAFSVKTSKILPQILCRHFRHVAPIICDAHGRMVLYQFVRYRHIIQIPITHHGIKLLQHNGWVIMRIHVQPNFNNTPRAFTCVDLTKRTIGIHAPFIQTPDALYKFLTDNLSQ